jgi:predicted patatin/cPLA2 family phospholipase
MDFKKLAQTPTKLLFPLTRVTDGKTVFAKVPKTPLLFEYLRAAKAAPIIYGRQVKIGRTSYIDGDFGTNLGDLVRHALTEGAEDIIVIDSDPGIEKNKMRSFILKSLYLEKRWAKETGIVSALKREIKRSPFPRPKNANVIVLSPSSSVPISTVTRRKSVLRRAFNLGFEDVTKNKKLKLLFNEK